MYGDEYEDDDEYDNRAGFQGYAQQMLEEDDEDGSEGEAQPQRMNNQR
jgi:hypothetical protein